MKKCYVLPIIALASFLIFSLYACGSNNTGFELQPNTQRNHYTDTVLTQQEFPRIGAVQYTYSFAELMFTAQFAAPEGKDITTHPLYPKKYESENALIDALKNGKIDIALIHRVSSATDFPDGITARKLSSDALVFRLSRQIRFPCLQPNSSSLFSAAAFPTGHRSAVRKAKLSCWEIR